MADKARKIAENVFEIKKKEILNKLYEAVPSGVGREGSIKMSDDDLKEIFKEGAQWMVKKGYGEDNDCTYTEENGKLENANPEDVSQRAKARGKSQLGSLGSGNHFLEVQKVEKIFDKDIAKVFGLEENQIVIMIHCGSRGLGHQTASDYIMKMEKEYGYKHLPDRELINAPINSVLGKDYRV